MFQQWIFERNDKITFLILFCLASEGQVKNCISLTGWAENILIVMPWKARLGDVHRCRNLNKMFLFSLYYSLKVPVVPQKHWLDLWLLSLEREIGWGKKSGTCFYFHSPCCPWQPLFPLLKWQSDSSPNISVRPMGCLSSRSPGNKVFTSFV